MAHKKAGGSTALGRESQSKRLGIKMFQGERASKGSILVRQRGTKFHAGVNVKRGGDDTLYSAVDGIVRFSHIKKRKFDGHLRTVKLVHVTEKSS